MQVLVNGVRLFFDVGGASLVRQGRTMREKPTLVLLHSGPGFDHSIYKPTFLAMADIAQVVFLDYRGNGRSDRGPRKAETLAQWGDDVHTFCEVLVSNSRAGRGRGSDNPNRMSDGCRGGAPGASGSFRGVSGVRARCT
jgi:pimeloyl-ACP methyl ester carboxylesterase